MSSLSRKSGENFEESSYTYIKEIENGTAYSTLGEEEKQALQKAISSDED